MRRFWHFALILRRFWKSIPQNENYREALCLLGFSIIKWLLRAGLASPIPSDPAGIQTLDLQNRKQTLKSPKTPLFIGLSRICHFHFAAILRLSQTGTWFICLFLFRWSANRSATHFSFERNFSCLEKSGMYL